MSYLTILHRNPKSQYGQTKKKERSVFFIFVLVDETRYVFCIGKQVLRRPTIEERDLLNLIISYHERKGLISVIFDFCQHHHHHHNHHHEYHHYHDHLPHRSQEYENSSAFTGWLLIRGNRTIETAFQIWSGGSFSPLELLAAMAWGEFRKQQSQSLLLRLASGFKGLALLDFLGVTF